MGQELCEQTEGRTCVRRRTLELARAANPQEEPECQQEYRYGSGPERFEFHDPDQNYFAQHTHDRHPYHNVDGYVMLPQVED